jgi:hypothetical protein
MELKTALAIIVIFLIANTLFFTMFLITFLFKQISKDKRIIQESIFKEKEIESNIVKTNLELAKTYKELTQESINDRVDKKETFDSFGKAITNVFKEIEKGE